MITLPTPSTATRPVTAPAAIYRARTWMMSRRDGSTRCDRVVAELRPAGADPAQALAP
jgi:hypothetical protein